MEKPEVVDILPFFVQKELAYGLLNCSAMIYTSCILLQIVYSSCYLRVGWFEGSLWCTHPSCTRKTEVSRVTRSVKSRHGDVVRVTLSEARLRDEGGNEGGR